MLFEINVIEYEIGGNECVTHVFINFGLIGFAMVSYTLAYLNVHMSSLRFKVNQFTQPV